MPPPDAKKVFEGSKAAPFKGSKPAAFKIET